MYIAREILKFTFFFNRPRIPFFFYIDISYCPTNSELFFKRTKPLFSQKGKKSTLST